MSILHVRNMRYSDIDAIERIKAAQGYSYDMPQLDSPLFVVRKVCTNGNNVPLAAAALRLTAEAFLMVDPDAEKKACMVIALHEAVREAALAAGLEDVQATLAPQIEEKFGYQLMRLGWQRHDWKLYSRKVSLGREN